MNEESDESGTAQESAAQMHVARSATPKKSLNPVNPEEGAWKSINLLSLEAVPPWVRGVRGRIRCQPGPRHGCDLGKSRV